MRVRPFEDVLALRAIGRRDELAAEECHRNAP
jgi:hypothetical protein